MGFHFHKDLLKYAKLAIKVGVNVQKDQYLYIVASTDAVEFVQVVTNIAYEHGVKQGFVDFTDDQIGRLRYELAPSDSFDLFPPWKVQEREWLAEQG